MEIYNAVELIEQREKNYNDVCGRAMLNVLSMSKPQENNGVIAIKNFNIRNPEHKFILSIARAVSSIAEARVAVQMSPIRRWWMNRKLPEECRLLPYKEEYNEYAINPDFLLNYMRLWAAETCGEKVEDFDFGDIYYEFYA